MQRLTYKTYLTGKASPTDELVMIVLLHFMGSNPDQTFEILLEKYDYPARVVAPYGQYRHGGEYSWFSDSLYGESEEDQGKFTDEIAGALLENVETWERKFPTQGKPIVLGVSQSGDICFTLAAKYTDRFRLCLPVAGRLLIGALTGKGRSGMVRIHYGREDPIVPIDSVRKSVEYFLSSERDVEIREYEGVGHAVPPEMLDAIYCDISVAIKN